MLVFYKQAKGANTDYFGNNERSERVWGSFPMRFFFKFLGENKLFYFNCDIAIQTGLIKSEF